MNNSSGTARSSSSETSSSFDFFPPASDIPANGTCQLNSPMAHHQRRCVTCFGGPNGLPDTCRPPPPIEPVLADTRSPGQDRRGKFGNRGGSRNRGSPGGSGGSSGGGGSGGGFFNKSRQHWRGAPPPDYASDHAREVPRGRVPPNFDSRLRPQSTTGINSDISSPDLGVDLGCSDPFSSLERTHGLGSSDRLRGDVIHTISLFIGRLTLMMVQSDVSIS